jgi:hypothetical protein
MDATSRRLMRICAIFMAVVAVGLLAVHGFTWWTVAGAALLFACPVYVLWAIARLEEPTFPGNSSSSDRSNQ